jgi:hypothetical protein
MLSLVEPRIKCHRPARFHVWFPLFHIEVLDFPLAERTRFGSLLPEKQKSNRPCLLCNSTRPDLNTRASHNTILQ